MAARILTPIVIGIALVGTSARAAAFDHSHARFSRLLERHVEDGRVNYGALSRERAGLDAYAKELAAAEVRRFSRNQALAFWINAYNAFTLQLIIDQKPQTSIRQIDGAWGKFRFAVGGKMMTLNDIEHQVLRKEFEDPRIHAVLVCAARSCPILESRAFVPATIDERLDAAARRFANDPERNTYDPSKNVLRVSKIFEWYGGDFIARFAQPGGGGGKDAAIRGFLRAYGRAPIAAGAKVVFAAYDWRLNGTW